MGDQYKLFRMTPLSYHDYSVSFRVIQATVHWHTFKTFMFIFINSSSSQKLFCQVPNQCRSLMTFRNKIQTKTFTWPDMSFYARQVALMFQTKESNKRAPGRVVVC